MVARDDRRNEDFRRCKARRLSLFFIVTKDWKHEKPRLAPAVVSEPKPSLPRRSKAEGVLDSARGECFWPFYTLPSPRPRHDAWLCLASAPGDWAFRVSGTSNYGRYRFLANQFNCPFFLDGCPECLVYGVGQVPNVSSFCDMNYDFGKRRSNIILCIPPELREFPMHN